MLPIESEKAKEPSIIPQDEEIRLLNNQEEVERLFSTYHSAEVASLALTDEA